MPIIRVDDEVFAGLQRLATPFVDTPNLVIRRLLAAYGGAASIQPPKQEESPLRQVEVGSSSEAIADELDRLVEIEGRNRRFARTPAGRLTPQPVLEDWILVVLDEKFGGRGEKRDVTGEIVQQLEAKGILSRDDYAVVKTGETKVANTIAWGRNRLKELGLISQISPRGVWELTEQGRALAHKLRGAQ